MITISGSQITGGVTFRDNAAGSFSTSNLLLYLNATSGSS
jgi:hypothetical protein